MNYTDLLTLTAYKYDSIVCLGLDPVLEQIPFDKGSPNKTILFFYKSIINALFKNGVYPSAVKPNYAFFSQYGINGIKALVDIIRFCREKGLPVILDVKRGDIGTTAEAYSREAFEFFNADAVTLSPYMGYDSIAPFVENFPFKGYYILNKTSNRSSSEVQDVEVNGAPLYVHIAKKIIEWHSPGMGAVLGATYPDQLSMISKIFIESGKMVPLLIPGIGSQGGSVEQVCSILRLSPDYRIHRINSSSAINYAYKRYPGLPFQEASVLALDELNKEINASLG